MESLSKYDVPVLVIFFVRDDTLSQVFSSLKVARPSKLLLWQDGPRSERDMSGIMACRKIFERIDWECEVVTNYHTENMGCDPSTFRAQKWAFSLVDRCIVLEDDMVPSQSFYSYCKELLDKYENDERINHICGVNPLETADMCPNDYLFAYSGTGAWASWKRVAKGWDTEYSFLDKQYYLKNFSKRLPVLSKLMIEHATIRRDTGYEWWESIMAFNCLLNNRLVIIPKYNLVTNVGVTENATHGSDFRLMNKRVRNLFFMEAKEMPNPIKHPEYIVPDYDYMNEVSKINCLSRPILAKWRKVEYIIKLIRYGYFGSKIKNIISK